MRRLLAVIVLILAVAGAAGCFLKNPHVVKGGGERITVEPAGTIRVQGHVVNEGSGKAYDVSLHFKFSQGGAVYLERGVSLGKIDAGGLREFDVTFYGPPIDLATFSWDYSIDWD